MAASEQKLNKIFDQNVQITGDLTVDGNLVGFSGDNFYLDGITKSGNTLTFSVNGATNQTYTFGSNAFTSYTDHSTQGYLTSIPSHTHDDRYYTESEIQTFFDRGYLNSHGANNLAVGWYTIATNTGDRALAEFQIWDTASSDHQSVLFNASHHFGNDNSNDITVLANSRFGGTNFRYIRIKDGGTYDGAALQVYVDGSTNSVNVAIVGGNAQSNGWVLKDWIPDATDPGDLSNYSSFGVRCQVDLDQVINGGIITTGEIYSGGETSQFRVLNTGDEGSGNGLDADLLDGQHASSFAPAGGSAGTDWYCDDLFYDQWIRNNGTGDSGLYWHNSGHAGYAWHIYPQSRADMTFRTGAGNGGIKGTVGDATARGYVHWTTSNEIGFLNASRSWSLRVDNSGNTFATASHRAPIFYDSNDTTYYIDPASTGTSIKVRGTIENPSIWINDGDEYNGYNENIRLFNPANGVSVIAFAASGTTGTPTSSILGYSDRHEVRRGSNWETRTYDGYQVARGSYRAPTFYDSNNTGYYVDPAGTSVFNQTNTNSLLVNGTYDGYYGHTGMSWGGSTGYPTIYSSHSDRWVMFIKPHIVWTQNGQRGYTGNTEGSMIRFEGNLSSDRTWDLGCLTEIASSGDYFGAVRNLGSTTTWAFYADPSMNLHANASMRAPIFYDSNNTGYYINPAGLSYVNEIRSNEAQANPRYDTAFYVLQAQHWYGDNSSQTMYIGESGNDVLIRGQVAIGGTAIQSGYALTMTGHVDLNNSEINYVRQLHFNDNVRFYDDGNDSYLNFKYGDGNNGGIKFLNGSAAQKGYLYADNSYFGLLSANGTWAVRTADGGTFIDHRTDSPVYYDSDDTNWYVNPNNVSNLWNLRAYRMGITNSSSTTRYGISLYGGEASGEPTYGLLFTGTSLGTHGSVTGNWATYFTMNNDNSRGWIFRRVGSGNCASISGGGTASFNGDVIAYYSDMRLKTKLGDIKDPIGKIQALNGFYYEPNEVAESYGYEKETRVGLSAQEVEAVLPEIVTDAPIGDGYKTVDYAKLVPVLVEAIKEQQKQIDELKSLINKS